MLARELAAMRYMAPEARAATDGGSDMAKAVELSSQGGSALGEGKSRARQVLGSSSTLAEVFRRCYARHFNDVLRNESPALRDAICRDMLRYFDPWPDWVLKIAVELFSVCAPTIQKKRVYSYLKFIHAIFFEVKLGSSQRGLPPAPDIDAKMLGAVLGHGVSIQEALELRAVQWAEQGLISPDELVAVRKKAMPPEYVEEALKAYLKGRSLVEVVALSEGLADAKARTFDKRGGLRETTATVVYRAIFADWPRIENMSGPTELCSFLASVLQGHDDPNLRLDRVKKICRRMGISFKGA